MVSTVPQKNSISAEGTRREAACCGELGATEEFYVCRGKEKRSSLLWRAQVELPTYIN
jgi:hypothetical protein